MLTAKHYILFLIMFFVKSSFCSVRISSEIYIECKVDIEQNKLDRLDLNSYVSCTSNRTSSMHPKSYIISVIPAYANTRKFTAEEIEILRIENADDFAFLPARIKKTLPNLKKIFIVNSGLIHLETNDMKQFGDDLKAADFHGNHLTALQNDLFSYNSNLKRVNLRGNPLKFIDPELCTNPKIDLLLDNYYRVSYDGCVFDRPFDRTAWRCGDDGKAERQENYNLIRERANFFAEEFGVKIDTDVDEGNEDEEIDSKSVHIFLVIFFIVTISSLLIVLLCFLIKPFKNLFICKST